MVRIILLLKFVKSYIINNQIKLYNLNVQVKCYCKSCLVLLLIFLPTISLPLYLQVLDEEKYVCLHYFIIIIYFKILDFGLQQHFRYVALKNSKEEIFLLGNF